MLKEKTDLVIIGGGPAGLSAGIYARQDDTNFVLLEDQDSCWFLKESINSHKFAEGFIGMDQNTTGTDLQQKISCHYIRLGGIILHEKVLGLRRRDDTFMVRTHKGQIDSRAVIIASGTKPRSLNIVGANKFKNFIHYYCTIDGRKYINKHVVVVGGRNTGVVAACYLYDIGCRVTLVEIKERIQAKTKYQHWLDKRDIKIFTAAEAKQLSGDRKLKSVTVLQNDIYRTIPADGLFVYIGRLPNLDICSMEIQTNLQYDQDGYILVDHYNQTSVRGLFAAGDVTSRLKQVITACGDGANAYYFAKKYIDRLR